VLISETIASDPNAINGAVSYTYDSVGNRKQMTSTLAPVPAGLFNYDANDRFTAGDAYDNDGNTISSGGVANAYDFENHLIQQGGVSIIYDGDGNRAAKTVAGVKTSYIFDDRNPTGYVQVLAEVQSSAITRSYVYGLELIEQDRINTGTLRQSTSYNVYDGHGSVRALTDTTGTVTDTYAYDAFGNLIHSTGTTPNVYLYSGEQFDPDLHLYYNRSRYLNVGTGRFWTMDTAEGQTLDPLSLHKYQYAQNEPVEGIDPTGNDDIGELSVSFAVNSALSAISTIILPTGEGGPGAQIISRLLLPQSVLQDILALTPDAAEVGANVSASINLRNPILGFAAGGGVEFLVSPRTGSWAVYTYVSPIGLASGSTATSIGGGATGGLVYNCPTSSDYGGQFYTVTVPMAVLPSNVRTKIAGDWSIAAFQGIGALIPAPYTSVFAAVRYALGSAFSSNGAITFFISPSGSHALGVALALGKSGSVGASTSNWSVAWSYYWQNAPSASVSFE
jgi:RHS repeat-associated protein